MELDTIVVGLLGTAVFALIAILASSMFTLLARIDALRVELRSEMRELRESIDAVESRLGALEETVSEHVRAHA